MKSNNWLRVLLCKEPSPETRLNFKLFDILCSLITNLPVGHILVEEEDDAKFSALVTGVSCEETELDEEDDVEADT